MTRAAGGRHQEGGDLHFIPTTTGICAADEGIVNVNEVEGDV